MKVEVDVDDVIYSYLLLEQVMGADISLPMGATRARNQWILLDEVCNGNYCVKADI